MIAPLPDNKVKSIIRNIVSACQDINKLNNIGYGYIYVASGFIAHYNRYGFIAEYSSESLRDDILRNRENNQFTNFRQGDDNYEYYKQKAYIYNEICKQLVIKNK